MSSFLSSKRRAPVTLTAKVEVARVVEEVVTLLPTWVQVLPAFFFYVLTHVAMFARPAMFFCLSAHVALNTGQLGLLFVMSQGLLAVQFMPSAIGTLDGGMLLWADMPGLAITGPQCMAFLLCIRFWDAAVVALGALLATGTGVAFLQTLAQRKTGESEV